MNPQNGSAQETYYRALVEGISDYAIFRLDPDGRVVGWNTGAKNCKGYSEAEIIGRHHSVFYTQAEISARKPQELLDVAATQGRVEDEGWRVRKDGSQFWADVVLTALRDNSGVLVGFAKITRDLTGRREIETALSERNEQLQSTLQLLASQQEELRARNQELASQQEVLRAINAELAIATVASQEANRLKSEFLANMSHELRTPLNSILGYSELVLESRHAVLDEQSQSNLHVIMKNGHHLLSLINDVLDLAKVEAGATSVFAEPVDAQSLLLGIAHTALPMAQEKGIVLQLDLSADLGSLKTDETKLRQIVLNLVTNAIKFTSVGTVSMRAHLGGNERFIVEVQDTGLGIAPEHHQLVFDEFRQVDARSTRTAGGTGLGLAISRKLARLLGGDVTLVSELGTGSTFRLDLPREIVGDHMPTVIARPPTSSLEHPRIGRKLPVVAIDDDPEMLQLIAERLKGSPYVAIPASTGESGLELVRRLKPVAITLDIILPNKDGWSVLRELKGDPATADIPVVIMSATDSKVVGYALGAAGYITKPVGRNELLAMLDRFSGRTRDGYVLVIEDDAETRDFYRQLLEAESVRLHESINGREGITAMAAETPALIILDLMMPDMNGFEVLAWLRTQPYLRHVPVVVVTARNLTPEDYSRLSAAQSVICKGELTAALLHEELRIALGPDESAVEGVSM